MKTTEQLASLSQWVDESIAGQDADAITWGRVSKVGEEFGEVMAAMIGWQGHNPRKGYTHRQADVVAELLDTAIAALCAVEHLNGNDGSSFAALVVKIDTVAQRAGLDPFDGAS